MNKYTAIVREDNQVHILKCKIIDKTHLIFQMYNKTTEALSPPFKKPANFGMLEMIKPNAWQRKWYKERKLTKNISRYDLIGYYMQFKLMGMVTAFHSK